jgi:hypothetical protein
VPQRDVLLRWLEQLSLLIRRLLYGPGPVDIELAEHHIQDALEQHLGPMTALVARLDVPSVATLLHDPDRIFGYAQLVGLQAAVLAARGDPGAAALQVRAVGLAREAIARSPEVPAEWSTWLAETQAWSAGAPAADAERGTRNSEPGTI